MTHKFIPTCYNCNSPRLRITGVCGANFVLIPPLIMQRRAEIANIPSSVQIGIVVITIETMRLLYTYLSSSPGGFLGFYRAIILIAITAVVANLLIKGLRDGKPVTRDTTVGFAIFRIMTATSGLFEIYQDIHRGASPQEANLMLAVYFVVISLIVILSLQLPQSKAHFHR